MVAAGVFMHGGASRTEAWRHRQVTLLAWAFSDKQVACGLLPELSEVVEGIADYLVWHAPGGSEGHRPLAGANFLPPPSRCRYLPSSS